MGEIAILLGSLLHETNTFAESPTTRADIKGNREFFGEELLAGYRETETEIGGALDIIEDTDVGIVPTVGAELMPGGLVVDDLYEEYVSEIIETADDHSSRLSGVFLALHGAMVTEQRDDPEGELLSRLRDVVGTDVPIIVTLDLHAQVTDRMVECADALIAYETYPHVDMGDTGREAMELLLDAVAGRVDPVTAMTRPPVLAWAPKQNTRDGPMAELMADARDLESHSDVLKTNIVPGFLSSDIPGMGFTVPVVTDGDRSLARDVSMDLAGTVWDRREDFQADYPDAEEAVRIASERVQNGQTDDGPVVLADSGDNPGSGAPADGTLVLRELLESDIENAGVALICDPAVVETCLKAGVGSSVEVSLGGKTDDLHGDPIDDLDGYVRTITDGVFTNRGEMATGVTNDLGRAVRLECGPDRSVTVIVTTNRLQPYDTEIWRHVGIQPERLDVLLVKSKNHFRADYEPIASDVVLVNTPGLGAVDPNRFEFSRIDRPRYPLDEMADDAFPESP